MTNHCYCSDNQSRVIYFQQKLVSHLHLEQVIIALCSVEGWLVRMIGFNGVRSHGTHRARHKLEQITLKIILNGGFPPRSRPANVLGTYMAEKR